MTLQSAVFIAGIAYYMHNGNEQQLFRVLRVCRAKLSPQKRKKIDVIFNDKNPLEFFLKLLNDIEELSKPRYVCTASNQTLFYGEPRYVGNHVSQTV